MFNCKFIYLYISTFVYLYFYMFVYLYVGTFLHLYICIFVASPSLSRNSVRVAKVEEKEVRVDLEDMKKEKEECLSLGASAGDPTIFTLRSFQPDVAVPTLSSFPLPTMSPFPPHSQPSYIWIPTIPSTSFYSSPSCGLMPGHQWLICGTCHSWGSVIMS